MATPTRRRRTTAPPPEPTVRQAPRAALRRALQSGDLVSDGLVAAALRLHPRRLEQPRCPTRFVLGELAVERVGADRWSVRSALF